MQHHKPPKYALRFLRWFCHEDYLEEIEGNLLEIYDLDYEDSPRRANRQFTWNVLRHFRPAFIRSFKIFQLTNHRAMLRHNLILSFRNFQRYKSTFLINLIGLSSGLACALLILLWVQDELNVDKFHANDAQLYQVMLNAETPSGIRTLEWTPGPLAQSLVEEVPEVKYATAVHPPGPYTMPGVFSVGEANIKAEAKYVGKDYFNIFSYPLTAGNPNSVLREINSVAISEATAIKLFGTTDDVVGKTIKWKQESATDTYLITGIFQKIPANASIQFDVVFNYERLRSSRPELDSWSYNDPSTYVVLKESAQLMAFKDKITNFIQRNEPESRFTLFPRKYSSQHLYGNYENGKEAGGRITYVRLFTMIAIIILLTACINFTNLATARASRRFKELGVKKAIGAQRSTLAIQHLTESTLIAFLSLGAAIVLALILLPQFNQITSKQLTLFTDPTFIVLLLGTALFTGLVAGSYPALYLSGFDPVQVLKSKTVSSTGSVWIRKGLVVFQFAVSVILISLVWVVYQQMEHVQNKPLGYEKDNVVTFTIEGLEAKALQTFLEQIERLPGVTNVSAMSGDLTNGDHNNTTGLRWEGMNEGEEVNFTDMKVSYNFFETLEIATNAGRTYSDHFNNEATKLVLNQTAVEEMGLENPVGKTVKLWGQDRQIVGVVSDFHFESLYSAIKPCFFRLAKQPENILVKIQSGREKEALAQINDLYQRSAGVALAYQFLDQEYQALYTAEQRVSTLSKYFAGLAVLISCLGLFGLAAFTAERRLKEIGIRKTLGASSTSIVQLLTDDFTKMVMIAVAIALPVSYLAAQSWLQNFAFHIDLQWWYFAGAGAIALLIAWLTVSFQTIRAARVNPVECLKDE